jgi:hypothetical protein
MRSQTLRLNGLPTPVAGFGMNVVGWQEAWPTPGETKATLAADVVDFNGMASAVSIRTLFDMCMPE